MKRRYWFISSDGQRGPLILYALTPWFELLIVRRTSVSAAEKPCYIKMRSDHQTLRRWRFDRFWIGLEVPPTQKP